MATSPRHVNVELFRPGLIHPVSLYIAPWLVVCGLFSLGWSSVLTFSIEQVGSAMLVIVGPLTLAWFYWQFAVNITRSDRPVAQHALDLDRMLVTSRWLLITWAALSCFEIWASRGVPVEWFLTGSIPAKSYFAFGIPSVHGFVNTMLLAAVTMRVALGFITARRYHYLALPLGLAWSVVLISRQMMVVLVMQAALIALQYRRISATKIATLSVALLLLIIAFGVVGDFRTPLFLLNTAAITTSYPKWLPSGFIWVYLYFTTPLANLAIDIQHVAPSYDWSFPQTAAILFPTVIRQILYSGFVIGEQGDQISAAFNMSTAYLGPYQDFGVVGICVFAWITMGAVVLFWHRRDVFGSLGYATVGQCAFFSIFFNHFFYLPLIFQIFWFRICIVERRSDRSEMLPPEGTLIRAPWRPSYDSSEVPT